MDALVADINLRTMEFDEAIRGADAILPYLRSDNSHIVKAREAYVDLAWRRYRGESGRRCERLSARIETNLERARQDGINTEDFSVLEKFYDKFYEKQFRQYKEDSRQYLLWSFLRRIGATTAPLFTPDSIIAGELNRFRGIMQQTRDVYSASADLSDNPRIHAFFNDVERATGYSAHKKSILAEQLELPISSGR